MSAIPSGNSAIGAFAGTNNIQIHYLDYAGTNPPVVLMPGLTNNAHSFGGLIHAGLNNTRRVLALDLRGRGLSDKPDTGYGMEDHAADVVGLLDALGLDQAVLGGHSFGGMLALYLAAKYPDRFSTLVIIDSAISWPSGTGDLLKPSLNRLDKVFPSWDAYLNLAKGMPFLDGYWDQCIEEHYRADVEIRADSSVKPRTPRKVIQKVSVESGKENWHQILAQVKHPTLLLNAPGAYGAPGTPPVLPYENAIETARALANGQYVRVPGNHLTMIFGENAKKVVKEITRFVEE